MAIATDDGDGGMIRQLNRKRAAWLSRRTGGDALVERPGRGDRVMTANASEHLTELRDKCVRYTSLSKATWGMVSRASFVGVFGLVFLPRAASADSPIPPAPAARASSIVALAESLKGALGAVPQGALVVVAPTRSDVPLSRGEELSVRIAQIVAGKVSARAHDKPALLGQARALAGRASSLVFVQPEIEKGELRLVGDVYPVITNGWERLKNPAPGPHAHAFARGPVDAEVRAFMPPIVIEQGKVTKAKHAEGEVLAVACGDVDGDGAQEIALVTLARVVVGRLVVSPTAPGASVFRVEKSVLFRDLASRLPTPLREPLGGAAVLGESVHGSLLVGTSERGGVSLGPDLRVRHVLSGLPVAGSEGCASLDAEHGAFDGLRACSGAHPMRVVPLGLPARFDAVSELSYVDGQGAPHSAVVTREPSAKLKVRIDGADVHAAEGVGGQVLLVDLDLDGSPELVSTAAEGDDRIVVTSLGRGPKVRLRLDAKEGVRALAACPPEALAKPVLVAAVGQEVWLVR